MTGPIAIRRTGSRRVTNVVMMGMGEPLYNFEAVRDALLDRFGQWRRHRHLAPAHHALDLRRGAEHPVSTGDEIGVMLAISLHAVRDELRNELVPLNRKYPLAELLQACRDYPGATNAQTHHVRICDAERTSTIRSTTRSFW